MNKPINFLKNHKTLSITILFAVVAIIIVGILLYQNKKNAIPTQTIQTSQKENEVSPVTQNIILNLDSKGLEVGTKFAIFENITELSENSETDQSENSTTETTPTQTEDIEITKIPTENQNNIEKTFIIISLEDPAFEETTSNITDYETGTLTENGFEITTSNEDLIALSKLDQENLQISITVINSNYQEDNSWDIAEDAVDTKVDLNKEKNANGPKYYIRISYTSNIVAIYTKDDSGDYNNLVKTMVCSTGTATPRGGVYKLNYKYRWLPLFGGVYGQYCTRITGNILFHSVPYLRNYQPDSLEYWEYDKLGTSASAGCVRLTVADAKWIYENCASGCYVEFCTTLNVAKPSAAKISSNEACRNYDPTDPVANNPWRNYVEPTPSPEPSTTPSESPKPDQTPSPTPEGTEKPNPGEDSGENKDPNKEPTPSPDTGKDENPDTGKDSESSSEPTSENV